MKGHNLCLIFKYNFLFLILKLFRIFKTKSPKTDENTMVLRKITETNTMHFSILHKVFMFLFIPNTFCFLCLCYTSK